MEFKPEELLLIKKALFNSLSVNKEEREEAARFLSQDCEPNPSFQLALIQIVLNADGNQQLQYQALICMKNSLQRLLQRFNDRSRRTAHLQPQKAKSDKGGKTVGFVVGGQPNQDQQKAALLTEEMRQQIKEQILLLVQDNNNIIMTDQAYEQLTLVAAIFIKYDFPAQWPQLNQWLLKTFDQLHQRLPNLQITDAPKIKRFLIFYHEVMIEQSKKKLTNAKAHYQKIGKDYLKAIAKVWQFFTTQEEQMIMNPQTNELLLQNFNQTLFDIAAKLDKVLMLAVQCGFSLNELPKDQDSNPYVETIHQLIHKLKFFVSACQQVFNLPESEEKQKFKQILINQVKTFLKHLSDLQNAESLLMFKTLDHFLQVICLVIGQSDNYPARVNKLAMISLYRILNTQIYNQNTQYDLEPHQNGIGILVSPVKFKNFQPLIEQVAVLYQKVLDQPNEEQPDNQDGARRLLELITYKFLSQVDLSLWQSEPEAFIENEDEQFMLEYDLQHDTSLNLLALHLIEKLIQKFYNICYPFIQDILKQYFNGQLQNQLTENIEDAILNLVGIVGKVQKEYKVPMDKRLDVCFVLSFIHQHKWQNPVFKRRYLLIITHWTRLLPKMHFLEVLQSVLLSLQQISVEQATQPLQQVLIYEHCHCIHEMVKEIGYWLQRQEQVKKGSRSCIEELPKDIGELRGNQSYTDSEEDQITLSQLIDSQLNYSDIFLQVCSKLVALLDVFQQPALIWNMINFLSYLLEKNLEKQDQVFECLRSLNILKILSTQEHNHVNEAIMDMLKSLLCQCPSSPVILQLCCELLDHELSKSLNDSTTILFWLFTMRAVSQDNPNLALLKQLFVKFSGCLTTTQGGDALPQNNCVANTMIKRDYIYIEFLKVGEEAALLQMFNQQEQLQQIIQFATFKFISELEDEKLQVLKSGKETTKKYQSDSNDDSDEVHDVSLFEKKMYLIMIPHTLFWQVQTNQEQADFVFNCQRQLVAHTALYLAEANIAKSQQSSASFLTQLLTYLNRMIVVKTPQFMTTLAEMLVAKNLQLQDWIKEWFKKMDFLVSQESLRVNCLAIYCLLPHIPADLVRRIMPEIGRLTFQLLEQNLFLKLTNNKSRFHSPSRVGSVMSPQLMKNSQIVRLRTLEKISQRYEDLKKNDRLLDLDLIEHFWTQTRMLAQNLQIQDASLLAQLLGDEHLSTQFSNLVKGHSPRYEQYLRERQEQPQSAASAM